MSEWDQVVMALIRGTAIANDEVELVHLRELTPVEQIEVGFVFWAALLEENGSQAGGSTQLTKVRSVVDAQRFLNTPGKILTYNATPYT